MARARPKALTLTDAAAARMQAIMAGAAEDFVGVKVGVKNGGCAGMEYTMDYATEIGPLDEVVEDNGVKILIDPKAILFLLGSEIDFVTEKLSQRFVFNNPNQTDACGCGESVTLKPADSESV
ncbi:MAG: iron-sulfur cluster assembly accessory protein [Pseudomonadota bacterium]